MSNDPHDNEVTDRGMLRRYRDDQEMTMNNDDERDYDKDQLRLTPREVTQLEQALDEPGPGTRVVVFRVPVTIGARVSDKEALAGMTRILARAWQRLVPVSELAGPVTVIPDASQVPVHCAYCGAEVEEQDTGLWETGGDTADERRYCVNAPDHLHAGEATLCDRCGGNLVAGEGDGRYCGPCANTPDPEDDMFRRHAGQGSAPVSRTGHRTAAMYRAGMAERSDPEFAPGLGFAALTHAVLALSAPAGPGPDSAWRQRAIVAEAALTTIGGIIKSPDGTVSRMEQIRRVLRQSGQEADRIMAAEQTVTEPGEITVIAADLAAVLPRIRHQLTLTPDERARVSRLEQAVTEAGLA